MMYDTNLEGTFSAMHKLDPRRAAEIAYVIAVLSARKGDVERARRYGLESMKLLREEDIQTQEDAAARYLILNGVALPDMVTEELVSKRLEAMGVRCSVPTYLNGRIA